MKEITAIIRRDKLHETKAALAELGLPSVSIQSVDGRGKQRGDVACTLQDMDEDGRICNSTVVPLKTGASTSIDQLCEQLVETMRTNPAPWMRKALAADK